MALSSLGSRIGALCVHVCEFLPFELTCLGGCTCARWPALSACLSQLTFPCPLSILHLPAFRGNRIGRFLNAEYTRIGSCWPGQAIKCTHGGYIYLPRSRQCLIASSQIWGCGHYTSRVLIGLILFRRPPITSHLPVVVAAAAAADGNDSAVAGRQSGGEWWRRCGDFATISERSTAIRQLDGTQIGDCTLTIKPTVRKSRPACAPNLCACASVHVS